MSSKEQYKDALKSKNKIITDQGLMITKQHKELLLKDKIIRELKDQISVLKIRIDLKKKWWQFWK